MKVELTIADDRELRAAIKDEIKGVIVQIARGEIRQILAEVVKEGVLPKSKDDIDRIIRNEIIDIVRKDLKETNYAHDGVVKQIAREEVNRILKEILHLEVGQHINLV